MYSAICATSIYPVIDPLPMAFLLLMTMG